MQRDKWIWLGCLHLLTFPTCTECIHVLLTNDSTLLTHEAPALGSGCDPGNSHPPCADFTGACTRQRGQCLVYVCACVCVWSLTGRTDVQMAGRARQTEILDAEEAQLGERRAGALTWKMSTLKWLRLRSWAWLFSSRFTWALCLSMRSLTARVCALTLRDFSSSLLTVLLVEAWYLESLVRSFWIPFTEPSRLICRCSILCWFSCTASSMFTSLSRSVSTVTAFTCELSRMASSVLPRCRLGLGVEDGTGLELAAFSGCMLGPGCWNFSACTASSPMAAAQMGTFLWPRWEGLVVRGCLASRSGLSSEHRSLGLAEVQKVNNWLHWSGESRSSCS